MTGPVLPFDVRVGVTSSLDSVAIADPQLPYDVSVTVTTSSLITVPFIYVSATSSTGNNVVMSALEPYQIDIYPTESAGNTIVPSDVLPYTIDVYATESYNTFVVPSPQGTPQFIVSTTAESNAVSASYAQLATTASYLLGFVTSASYADTAGTLLGTVESASVAISSSYALTASWSPGSVSASYAQTASYVATASQALTASYALSNRDIELPVCSNQPANTVLKAISSQLNEPDSSDRFQFDLSTYSQYRVTSQIIRAGPSGSKLGVQYSTDQSNWNYLDITSGSLLSVSSTGIRSTNWFNLDVSSRSDVFIRWVACNGDDSSDVSFRYISLGVR